LKLNANDPGPASRQSLTLANAANADPTITDFGGIATPPPSEPPRLRFDWARDLIVDLSKTSVTPEKARGMKKLLIVAVIEEIGDPDWFVCKAIKVRKARKEIGDNKDQAGAHNERCGRPENSAWLFRASCNSASGPCDSNRRRNESTDFEVLVDYRNVGVSLRRA
jgi:hypothetical protein